jgi:tRNA(adenine34) deaminase
VPSMTDYMEHALTLARAAASRGEVPVGAVLVDATSGDIIAENGNQTEELNDPTAHAEVLVIRGACQKLATPRLENCDLYVTLEPCPMCATAISFARIRRLHFGAYDPKSGGVDHGPQIFSQPTCHHKPDVTGGHREQEAAALLKDFFAARRPT